MGGELVYNHADYRLMSKRALKGLLEFDEVNIFLRGWCRWLVIRVILSRMRELRDLQEKANTH